MRKFAFLLAFTLVLGAARTAAAYEFIADCRGGVRWNNNDVTFRPSLISFPQYSSWYYSLDAARVAWNSYTPGGNYRIQYSWDTNQSTHNEDGRNNIVMPAPQNWYWGGALAVTQYRRSMCYTWPGPDANWVEMDIAFSPYVSWDTSLNPVMPQNADYSINSTLAAVHEHGHGMGLAHENDQLATMNAAYPAGGPIGPNDAVHPHADDARGDRALYGTAATQRDIAAFAYRRSANPAIAEPIPAPGPLSRNTTVAVQFGVENRGTTSQSSVPVYFYLSPTRNGVNTSHYFLGSTTLSLNVGATVTPTAWLTIPTGVPAGNYYIGWIIDPFNGIIESDEINNRVTLNTPTQILNNSAPTACFNAYPTSGYSPLNVSFDATCSSDPDGNSLTYSWDFGDGSYGSGAVTDHWYYFAGSYFATLTVTDSNGASSQSSVHIWVTCDSGGQLECPQ